MNESQLHKHIEARSVGLALSEGWGVGTGPGDDAAVIVTPSGETVLLTVDQLVEGRHYEPGTEIDLIARKSIARSVSDIAAMGGVPVWALGTGVLRTDDPDSDALFDSMARWARRWGCPLVGGDISTHEHDHRILTVTIGGTMDEGHAPVLRSGARPGDLVYLTGQVGGSLESGWHLRFEPRIEHGRWASSPGSGVRAMMDLSDGLGRDSARLARASGVTIEIDSTKLPINHRCDDWRRACAEGEDYELVMCVDPGARIPEMDPPILGPIGVCVEPEGEPMSIVLDPYGEPHDVSDLGWDH